MSALIDLDIRLENSVAFDSAHRLQLPSTSYFCADRYQLEMDLIFQPSPKYVGHKLMVPEVGDFCALAHEGEGRALVHTPQGIFLLSNVCRHRQAIMLKGRGHTRKNIVCPLHRWTYDLGGELIGAPHFEVTPCLNLASYPIQSWNGLLFEDTAFCNVAQDLANLGPKAKLDFMGYTLDKIQVNECNYNWKTFIEVYLEDYHVGPFHPGLGHFVDCDQLQWEFGEQHCVQTVGLHRGVSKAGSVVYSQWHDQLRKYREGVLPSQGAIWLLHYPNIMVEWYPYALVVSTLHPRGPQNTLNVVEFYYPEEITAFERELVQAQQAAYWETCAEDDEIALRMDAGRHALISRGEDDMGPYQNPMENGMMHFHHWYQKKLSASIA